MSDGDKNRGVVVDHTHHHHAVQEQQQQQPPPHATFQGVANYAPPQPPPAVGFPQPNPPPAAFEAPAPPYQSHGYPTAQGFAVAEARPVEERRLPCCGIGIGWFLFILGFFLGCIPWWVGLFILLCGRIDPREKPGYIACSVAAAVATVIIVIGATKGAGEW